MSGHSVTSQYPAGRSGSYIVEYGFAIFENQDPIREHSNPQQIEKILKETNLTTENLFICFESKGLLPLIIDRDNSSILDNVC